MSKLVRKFALLIGAAALVAAAPVNALAAESKQTKYHAGPGGSTVCSIYASGESFIAGMGETYEVVVRPVVGTGVVQARIFFTAPNAIVVNGGAVGAMSQPDPIRSPFLNRHSGVVPEGATEAWVTVCRTDPDFAHGSVVVPVIIEYSEK